MSRKKDESKVRHTKDKLKATLSKYSEVELPQFLNLYNQTMTTDGICGTIHTRISSGNYWYVIINKTKKRL